MKIRCILTSCCYGIKLIDGIHGIVVWDSLYALFVITTAINAFIYFSQDDTGSKAITDLATTSVLLTRAAIGLRTCCSGFRADRVKCYFITRLIWDFTLLILNGIMAGLKIMPLQNFFFNIFVIIMIDGYLNMIIYSYMKQETKKLLDDEHRGSNLSEKAQDMVVIDEIVFEAVNDIAREIQDLALTSQHQSAQSQNQAIAQQPKPRNNQNLNQNGVPKLDLSRAKSLDPILNNDAQDDSPSNLQYRTNSNQNILNQMKDSQHQNIEQVPTSQQRGETDNNFVYQFLMAKQQLYRARIDNFISNQITKPIRKGRKQQPQQNDQSSQNQQLQIQEMRGHEMYEYQDQSVINDQKDIQDPQKLNDLESPQVQ